MLTSSSFAISSGDSSSSACFNVLFQLVEGTGTDNRERPFGCDPDNGDFVGGYAALFDDREHGVDDSGTLRGALGVEDVAARTFLTAFFTFAVFAG